MRVPIPVMLAILVTGCTQEPAHDPWPADKDIDRIETRLARHPCIGRLDRWERNYRAATKSGILWRHSATPDFGVIAFHYRRAGTVTITPGRNIVTAQSASDWPDSAGITAIDGLFNVKSGTLSLSRCQHVAAR